MYEDPPLLTIKRPARRPSGAQIKALSGVPTAVASDAMDGRGAMSGHIRHLDPAMPPSTCGPALTVWTGAADLLSLHAVKRIARAGDVIVHAFDGHQGCAAFGDSLGGMMKNAGVVAMITDGPVRDVNGLIALQMPVWCTGSISSTPYENGPGTAGLPVNIGAQRVETGDMIVADRDGVVVVPFDEIDAVAERSKRILTMEADGDKAVQNGLVMPDTYNQLLDSDRVKWVD